MNLLLSVIAAILLTACSSPPKYPDTNTQRVTHTTTATNKLVAKLQEANGSIELEFDDSGEWIALVAVGTEPITGSDAANAHVAAEMRARANIAYFLNSSVRTNRTLNTISKSIASSSTHSDNQVANATRKVTDRIVEQSSAMLRGARVIRRDVDGDVAVAYVAVTAMDITGSRMIADKMRRSQ